MLVAPIVISSCCCCCCCLSGHAASVNLHGKTKRCSDVQQPTGSLIIEERNKETNRQTSKRKWNAICFIASPTTPNITPSLSLSLSISVSVSLPFYVPHLITRCATRCVLHRFETHTRTLTPRTQTHAHSYTHLCIGRHPHTVRDLTA